MTNASPISAGPTGSGSCGDRDPAGEEERWGAWHLGGASCDGPGSAIDVRADKRSGRHPDENRERKSTTPRPISAERCVPLASPNSLTIALAIVSPGPSRCRLMLCDEPMTSATRDRLADRRPGRSSRPRRHRRGCAGTPRLGSSPTVDAEAVRGFLQAIGVVANTSRVIDVMIGVIMIATMIPAVM